METDWLSRGATEYALMHRCVLMFYTRLNQWRDGEPNEEGVLHGMADCYAELAGMGCAE